MTTTTMKYTLEQITDISFSGINFEIPEDTYNMINYLCEKVGSAGISSSKFQKLESPKSMDNSFSLNSNGERNNKKRKGNKAMEISSEEWESIRTFQATKIEQKSGLDADIDQIRLMLNKLTDKTFLDMREKLIDKINTICSEFTGVEDELKVGNMIYDICSTNKFYSRIFADLFAELASQYKWLNPVFENRYKNIMDQYKDIKYIDSDTDYDGFCDMNKTNEKRKAVTTFLVNLANNGFISKMEVLNILRDLLRVVCNMIITNDKKNEVDELTENIAILFNKDILDELNNSDELIESVEMFVVDKSIIETVNVLAKSKAKDYPSLSNKAIFKYMDLVEM